MYDVIIVGTRVAGAATAMLLARRGLRVLAVDRTTFPSDTLSTHQVQVTGVAHLHRWGLLDQIIDSGAPATRQVRFDTGRHVLRGCFPVYDGVDALYSPRRTVLDPILVGAARTAGADVREDFHVQDIVVESDRAVGIRGLTPGGAAVTERAPLIIGADGKHSLVARTMRARAYREIPALSVACYTYWAGVPMSGGEIYSRPGRAVGAWPTNDGLVMTYVACPISEFEEFRRDIEGNLLSTLDSAGDLGARVRAGTRAERIRTTPDVPNRFHQPYGPGWALVGDAGLVMDPITGQGISHAFRDAEGLTQAVADGLGGRRSLEAGMADHAAARDAACMPMYKFTTDLVRFRPPTVEERTLFASLAAKPAEIDRFLGVVAGAVPFGEYMTPGNLVRVIGVGGMAKVMWGKMLAGAGRSAQS